MKSFPKHALTNLERLKIELSEKEYFEDTDRIYSSVLEENDLDPGETYSKSSDQVNMLESVYSILQILANNIELYIKVETEFTTTSAAYQFLEKRLKSLREDIDKLKLATHYEDEAGNVSSITSYMFFNGVTD